MYESFELAAWVCLIAAVALAILVGLGFWHSRRTREERSTGTLVAAETATGAQA